MKLFFKAVVLAVTVLGSPAWAIPINDLIENATVLPAFDGTISGTTVGATFDNMPFFGTSNTTAGVWYMATGTGGDITFSTCNQASYDTKLTAYRGTIASLIGIVGVDDSAGCAGFTTEIGFTSVLNEDLWLLVHGFGGSVGTFDLSFSSTVAPPSGVPVPASVFLLGGGLLLLGLRRKRYTQG